MKYLLIVLMSLLFGCVAPQPARLVADPSLLPEIGGTLAADTVLAGNYQLVADLQVPAGVTLTIKPGTTIYIQPSDSTKIDPEFLSREVEILVRGSLIAIGSEVQPIVFKPVTNDPEAIVWSGLLLVESERVQLEHLLIEQAEVGVHCIAASPRIHSLHIQRCRYGILLQQQSAPQIKDSLLTAGEAGLFCWDQSAPVVTNSWFTRHQEEGLYLGRDCRGTFSGNLIKGNDRGVVLPVGAAVDASNRVSSNRQDFLHYLQENN